MPLVVDVADEVASLAEQTSSSTRDLAATAEQLQRLVGQLRREAEPPSCS